MRAANLARSCFSGYPMRCILAPALICLLLFIFLAFMTRALTSTGWQAAFLSLLLFSSLAPMSQLLDSAPGRWRTAFTVLLVVLASVAFIAFAGCAAAAGGTIGMCKLQRYGPTYARTQERQIKLHARSD